MCQAEGRRSVNGCSLLKVELCLSHSTVLQSLRCRPYSLISPLCVFAQQELHSFLVLQFLLLMDASEVLGAVSVGMCSIGTWPK